MAEVDKKVSLTDKKCLSLLSGLSLSPWQPTIFRMEEEKYSEDYLERQVEDTLKNLCVSSKMTCSVCNCTFQSRVQQTDHYKLDWHRFNLKQSMMGAAAVTEEMFETMTGDISSISGSDDSDFETTTPGPTTDSIAEPQSQQKTERKGRHKHDHGGWGPPKVYFKNDKGKLVAIYRCLLQGKKEGLLTQSELVTRATNLPLNLKWIILMAAGGHFAGAVYKGSEVIVHKTFHRYTVRARSGTAQGVRDNMQGGNQPKSAGSTLRRYNEAALYEDIGNLLKSWAEHVGACSAIFIRAPSYNRALFFGGKNAPFKRDDNRVRTIPFITRRPTFKEIQRVQNLLCTVESFDEEMFLSVHDVSLKKPTREGTAEHSEKEDDSPDSLTLGNGVNEADVVEQDELQGQDEIIDRQLSGESDEEIELIMEEMITSTSHLKETEVFIPKHKKRQKKKKAIPKVDYTLQDKQLRKFQAGIFTCCKTGDGDTFDSLIARLKEKLIEDMEKNMDTEASVYISGAGGSVICNHDKPTVLISNDDSPESERELKPRILEASIDINGEVSSKPSDSTSEVNLPEKNVETQSEDPPSGMSSNTLIINETSSSENGKNKLETGCMKTIAPLEVENVSRRIATFLNEKLDTSESTFLHIAAIEGHSLLLWKLLTNGADPALKNSKGLTPFSVSKDKNTRKGFRDFMGKYPERYDYTAAQIPAPLSDDQEISRAAKLAEKRREQKKAKKIKQKEKKEEQQRLEEEEREKQTFAALSDRDKRAMAAEGRFVKQMNSANRCFACGTSLMNKVPFHYQEFRFCSMPCLKEHKQRST